MVAGRPGSARSVPAGSSRRKRGDADDDTEQRPAAGPRARRARRVRPSTKAGAGGGADGVGDLVLLAGRRLAAGPSRTSAGHGEGSGHGHQRNEAEEDPAPTEEVATAAATAGPDDAGHHPGRRQHRHHPRPLSLGQAAADGDVGDRRHRARAQSLQAAPDDEHPHEREPDRPPGARRANRTRPATYGRAGPWRSASRPAATMPIRLASMEGREDPAVERQSMEVVATTA